MCGVLIGWLWMLDLGLGRCYYGDDVGYLDDDLGYYWFGYGIHVGFLILE